jgi:outer membrane lipoprotein carrier protein
MRPLAACRLALVSLVLTPPGTGAQQPSAQEFAQTLQKKYDTVRDFSADFQHLYTGGVLKKQLSERGRMLVKKPGKMRWEYSAPEKKTFVSDGVKIYSYIPADRQVIVTSVPRSDQATTPALFLAGQGNLNRDFTASDSALSKNLPAGTRALKLVPKSPQADFESLILAVDPATLTLRGLESVDAQGGTSTFLFANLKENVGLADRDFAFSMPRGVDVVTDDH